MNNIATRQNEEYPLQLLAAQRHLYSRAKRLLGLQLVLSGPVAMGAAVAGILLPDAKTLIALFGVSLLLLDIVWLTRRQKALREMAAKVQERFDCDVLCIEWNSVRVGAPEPPELVIGEAARHLSVASKRTALIDWYPVEAAALPLSLARIVCQRSNCWWDASQRRAYANVVAMLLMSGFISAMGVGVLVDATLANLLLAAMAMSSTVKVAIQLWLEHRDAANRLDALRGLAEKTWTKAIANPEDPHLIEEARSLQGEIFDGRKRNPLVFDFVFRMMRPRHNDQMILGARHLVAEAQAARVHHG